jgi:hypothetical protein
MEKSPANIERFHFIEIISKNSSWIRYRKYFITFGGCSPLPHQNGPPRLVHDVWVLAVVEKLQLPRYLIKQLVTFCSN